jgi:hypothetical protein
MELGSIALHYRNSPECQYPSIPQAGIPDPRKRIVIERNRRDARDAVRHTEALVSTPLDVRRLSDATSLQVRWKRVSLNTVIGTIAAKSVSLR